MALKDKEITLARAIYLAKRENWDTSTKVIPVKDIKEAVLEFEKILKRDLFNLFGEAEYNQPHIQELLQDYNKIFGDFK